MSLIPVLLSELVSVTFAVLITSILGIRSISTMVGSPLVKVSGSSLFSVMLVPLGSVPVATTVLTTLPLSAAFCSIR